MDADGLDQAGFFQKLINLYALQKKSDDLVRAVSSGGGPFVLSEELIKEFHRIGMIKLLDDAGSYRKCPVALNGSNHIPPNWIEVPAHMLAFCQYVNTMWDQKDLVHLSAFCLWRLNWIHPFKNGNGRTSRAISYLVLNMRHGQILPAREMVVKAIVENKLEYHAVLRMADTIFSATNDIEKSIAPVEAFLTKLLIAQIRSAV